MTNPPKLLPCPFCNGEPHIDSIHVYCSKCGCMPATLLEEINFYNIQDLLNHHIKLWNTRKDASNA